MKRFWGRAVAAATVAGLSAALVPACAHDDTTLFVYDVLAQPVVTVGTGCTFTSSVTQPFITQGLVDEALTDGYFAEFLVGNQMAAQANPNEGKTETSYITVQGAVVTVKDQTGTQVLAQYTVNVAATVPPASGTTPSYAPIGAVIVNNVALQNNPAGNTRFLTFTHFFGVTLGGQSVTSNDFEFPVDVCSGCLVAISPSDVSPCFESPNCIGNGTAAPPTTEPCAPGQDSPIDCSLCRTSIPACNPPANPINAPGCPSVTTMTSSSSSSSASGADAGPDATIDSGADASDGSLGSDSSDASGDGTTTDASGDGTTSDANLDATGD